MIRLCYTECDKNWFSITGGEYITEKEMIQRNIEDFSRTQRYMLLTERDSDAYKAMRERYIELEIILSVSGVNLTELDHIKE